MAVWDSDPFGAVKEARWAREAEDAQVAWAALCALDPQEASRQELLAANVPLRTVQELYPRRFEDLAVGVLNSLSKRSNLDHLTLTGNLDMLINYRRDARVTFNDRRMDPKLKKQWQADFALFEAAGAQVLALEDRLSELLAKWEQGEAIKHSFVLVLWWAWWFMEHREQLGEHQRKADRLMNLVRSTLLPDLVPYEWEEPFDFEYP